MDDDFNRWENDGGSALDRVFRRGKFRVIDNRKIYERNRNHIKHLDDPLYRRREKHRDIIKKLNARGLTGTERVNEYVRLINFKKGTTQRPRSQLKLSPEEKIIRKRNYHKFNVRLLSRDPAYRRKNSYVAKSADQRERRNKTKRARYARATEAEKQHQRDRSKAWRLANPEKVKASQDHYNATVRFPAQRTAAQARLRHLEDEKIKKQKIREQEKLERREARKIATELRRATPEFEAELKAKRQAYKAANPEKFRTWKRNAKNIRKEAFQFGIEHGLIANLRYTREEKQRLGAAVRRLLNTGEIK